MIRRILFALALAGALVAPLDAQPAHGIYSEEGNGLRPLRTWCASPAMTHCTSFNSWYFEYWNYADNSPYAYARANVDVTAPAGTPWPYFEMTVHVLTAQGWYGDLDSSFGGDQHWISGSSNTAGYVLRPTTLSDPLILEWGGGHHCVTRRGRGGSRLGNDPLCVAVPEPGSLLLLVTGAFGIAYVRKRRVA